ncbi:MAG: 3-deoxy-D-manno-octulosonic acid transferase [Nitrospirota bacterium]|nr:3-deoxy-D-manno-octulosonic acid transferase [Nitrospirota bacterium]
MRALYNLALGLALPGLVVALVVRVLSRPEYRPHLGERIARMAPSPTGKKPVIWLHAVSVGEVISTVPLARALRATFPHAYLLVTCGTPTGRSMAVDRLSGVCDRVSYAPYDYPWIAARAVSRIRPDLLLLMETELWPNLLSVLARRGVPVLLVNGRISDRSFPRYRRFSALFREAFQAIGGFLMQTDADAERVRALGAPAGRVTVAGNLKYDQPVPPADAAQLADCRAALGLSDITSQVLLAGSTHEGEEVAIARVWKRLTTRFPHLRLVLALRHPHRAAGVVADLARLGIVAGRKSLARDYPDAPLPPVMLLDTVGELALHYHLATVALIGGSLVPVGGHNPLEAAACGVPVIYGPHVHNFAQPCRALEGAGAAMRVAEAKKPEGSLENDLEASLEKLLADPALRARMGEAGKAVYAAHRGAVERILDSVSEVLKLS